MYGHSDLNIWPLKFDQFIPESKAQSQYTPCLHHLDLPLHFACSCLEFRCLNSYWDRGLGLTVVLLLFVLVSDFIIPQVSGVCRLIFKISISFYNISFAFNCLKLFLTAKCLNFTVYNLNVSFPALYSVIHSSCTYSKVGAA